MEAKWILRSEGSGLAKPPCDERRTCIRVSALLGFGRMAAATRSLANRNALDRLAALHGVQTIYRSMARRRVKAAPESILATLRALGVGVRHMDDCPAALRNEQLARARQSIEPVTIAWNGRCPVIPFLISEGALGAPARLILDIEEGGSIERPLNLTRPAEAEVRILDGARFVSCRLRIPEQLPTGYHDLAIESSDGIARSRILSAPERTFAPAGEDRAWGMFAPLYALRTQHNWGAGDYSDLGAFATWIGQRGGRVAATLPLLPLFLADPVEPSPYSPVSRLFWSEFYLDLDGVPELRDNTQRFPGINAAGIRERIDQLRAAPRVDYRAILALKRDLLEPCARRFFRTASGRREDYERFRRQRPHLDSYAAFRALQEELGHDWHRWPARLRGGRLPGDHPIPAAREYHGYAQWLAHQQVGGAARAARRQGVDLYLDLPLGSHPAGYDAWRFQSVFARGATGGAPPDPVFTQGQDWGFAPLHPGALRASGYRYLIDCLRHHLEFARVLRFDHVMALHRLYWIPSGLPASAGAYVTCPAEELYAVLSIESHRNQARIVGENLGTVPPEVNRALARHGVRGMHVVQYELRPSRRAPLPAAPRDSVASLNTHDMPPFAAYWHGLDIFDRFELGLLTDSGVRCEQRRRRRINRLLQEWLERREQRPGGIRQTSEVFQALLAHLRTGPAEVVLLNLEDAWLETQPQNVPGTTRERVNWQRKARFPIESWDRLTAMRQILDIINASRAAAKPDRRESARRRSDPGRGARPGRPRN
jgi:4-alpha-glucanotransferase